jgi:hypothetical protein
MSRFTAAFCVVFCYQKFNERMKYVGGAGTLNSSEWWIAE